jgi:hypothetical protein
MLSGNEAISYSIFQEKRMPKVTSKKVPISDIQAEITKRQSLNFDTVLFAADSGEVYLVETDKSTTPPTLNAEDGFVDGPDVDI